MALQLHNTLTRRKEPFVPRDPGRVGIYLCGITVYGEPHVGNLRNVVVFDVLRRHLTASGYEVLYVRNYTDVDDKIINAAGHDPLRAFVVAEHWTRVYDEITAALGVLPPDIAPRASGHIPEMLALIARLVDVGLAYQAGGDVYFAVGKWPEYGKLSGRDPAELLAGARVEINPHKRDPLDFALWKAAKPGEPTWDSPWGPGRPGWHIECSAMAGKYLGRCFDIHGGGEDLDLPPPRERDRPVRGGHRRAVRPVLGPQRLPRAQGREDGQVGRQRGQPPRAPPPPPRRGPPLRPPRRPLPQPPRVLRGGPRRRRRQLRPPGHLRHQRRPRPDPQRSRARPRRPAGPGGRPRTRAAGGGGSRPPWTTT